MRIAGVDTGMNGAVCTVDGDGRVVQARVLWPGPRQDGWSTPSPPEVARVHRQMSEIILDTDPAAIAYEQISATRGIAAARSLFMCEGLLLQMAHARHLPVVGVQQQTLRAWVRRHLDIRKWRTGKGKQQMLEAMDQRVLHALIRSAQSALARRLPESRYDDLADAYLCARWGQERIAEANTAKGAG